MPAEDKGTRAAPAGVLLRLRAGDWQSLPGHERCILFPCSAPWQSSLGAGESLLSWEHRWRKGSHAWERTQRCLCAGTRLPACTLLPAACPQAAHLYVPGAKRGSEPHRGLATSRRSETPAGAAWVLPATWAGLAKDTTSACKPATRLSWDCLPRQLWILSRRCSGCRLLPHWRVSRGLVRVLSQQKGRVSLHIYCTVVM